MSHMRQGCAGHHKSEPAHPSGCSRNCCGFTVLGLCRKGIWRLRCSIMCGVVQVLYLKGLRYIYQFNIFLYMMMGIMGISLIIMVIKGPGKWKRAKREDAYTF